MLKVLSKATNLSEPIFPGVVMPRRCLRFVLKRKRKNMQSSSKTIFINSFHVLVSRNILASPFFDLLKKDGWKIVVVMPEKKREDFERGFGGENVFFEGGEKT